MKLTPRETDTIKRMELDGRMTMIRLIVQFKSVCPSGEITGTGIRTFDISHAELESVLRAGNMWEHNSLIGAELIEDGKHGPA